MIRIPPAKLREKVSCGGAIEEYVMIGSRTTSAIQNFMFSLGYDLSRFERILDFACGCGRTLNYLQQIVPSEKLFGCDYDDELTSWCRRNLKVKSCLTNDEEPPIDYPSSHFDFIYAISFLTHLEPEKQLLWLHEWRRILRNDGLLLVSLHGPGLAARGGVRIPAVGHLFERHGPNFNDKVAYHILEYVREKWEGTFSIVGYSGMGLNDHQDLLLLGAPDHWKRRERLLPAKDLERELKDFLEKRPDLQRDFDSNGIAYPDSSWRNMSLRDWALFNGHRESRDLRDFSFKARFEVLETS